MGIIGISNSLTSSRHTFPKMLTEVPVSRRPCKLTLPIENSAYGLGSEDFSSAVLIASMILLDDGWRFRSQRFYFGRIHSFFDVLRECRNVFAGMSLRVVG